MSLFNCRICIEKDKRIEDLLHQVSNLEKLVFPPKLTQVITEDMESVSEVETFPEDPITREASLLLSGDYDRMNEGL